MRPKFLDELPEGAIVTDRDKTAWQKQAIAGLSDNGLAWVHATPNGIVVCPHGKSLIQDHGPLKLVTRN